MSSDILHDTFLFFTLFSNREQGKKLNLKLNVKVIYSQA